MTISRILITILFISSPATPHLSAMEPRPSASNSLSLPQTYHTLFEQFTLATETEHTPQELLQHIMQFHYHSDPIAFVQKLKGNEIEALFNQLEQESVFKMALRFGYAKMFGANIPGDELDVFHFVQNYKKYGVNDIKHFSTDLFKHPYLEHVLPLLELLIEKPVIELYLYNNDLTVLPESIGNLMNLKVLYLYNNQLTVLPESIGNLVNLEVLYLENNKLKVLPQSIGNLVHLKKLTLSGNQLTEVPESIGKLVNLKELTLYDNQLSLATKNWVSQQFSDLGAYLLL